MVDEIIISLYFDSNQLTIPQSSSSHSNYSNLSIHYSQLKLHPRVRSILDVHATVYSSANQLQLGFHALASLAKKLLSYTVQQLKQTQALMTFHQFPVCAE